MKKIFFLFLFVFLILLSSFVLMELILRKINYPYDNIAVSKPSPDTETLAFNPLTAWSYPEKTVLHDFFMDYYFDQYGIRAAKAERQIDFNKPRLVFIGCSITFGEGVSYEDSYPAVIGRLLDNQYEIINLGVQGYGADQAYLRLKQYVNDLRPSIVVYTFIPDHLLRNINFDRRMYFRSMYFPASKSIFQVKNQSLSLYRSVKRTEDLDRLRLRTLLTFSYDYFREKHWKKTGQDLLIQKQILAELENLGRENDFKVLYLHYDVEQPGNADSFNQYLSTELFTNHKRKVLNFFNWATLGAAGDYFVHPDDIYHPNSFVNSLIAREFVDFYQKELVSE